MTYDNTNTGVLFENEDKMPESKQPDFRGSIFLPDGTEKSLGGWWKTSKNGKTYLSLKVSDKWEKEKPAYKAQAQQPLPQGFTDGIDMDNMNDDIPFN